MLLIVEDDPHDWEILARTVKGSLLESSIKLSDNLSGFGQFNEPGLGGRRRR